MSLESVFQHSINYQNVQLISHYSSDEFGNCDFVPTGTPAAGQKVKERIDVFDEATRTIVYSTIEGGDPRLKSTKFTINFSAGPTSDTTKVCWQVDYVPVDASMPPPEDLKKFAETALKALDTYGKEHPEFTA